jgi:hypothetical protein
MKIFKGTNQHGNTFVGGLLFHNGKTHIVTVSEPMFIGDDYRPWTDGPILTMHEVVQYTEHPIKRTEQIDIFYG